MPTGSMSADPDWMKKMTAWVWISLATLALFAMAEEPCWDAGGTLSDPLTLFSDSESLVEKRSGGGFLPVPVWKFLKVSDGADSSDFNRPQFRCGNTSLYLRFSQVRHSDLRLQDGRSLLLLLDRCHGSVWIFGPWLLLEFPYTSCHIALEISNGKWFRQMEVSYFDYLQQTSVMTVINCEHPALSQCGATPAVSCSSTNFTVKLPLGARLQRVKALGKDAVLRTLKTTPEAVFVQISTQNDTDSILEIIFSDSAGEISTILATCTVKGSKRDRHPRGLGDLNMANYPYSPELSELIEARDKTEIMETETSCNEDKTEVTYSDSESINSPDGPDKSATAVCDGAEKQDDLPCCEQLDDLPCCEPLDDLPCCNPSEEDLSCSNHEDEDPPNSQLTGVYHGPLPGFSTNQYFSHGQSIVSSNQSTSSDSHSEGHPSKGQTEGRPSKGHGGKAHPSKSGGGEGRPSKGGEGGGEARPSKGGEGRPSKGHGGSRHEGLPSKGQTEARPSKGDENSGEGRPSKGHGGEGRPSKGHGGEGRPSKGHGGEGSGEGRPSKGHAEARPSKGHGGEGSGEARPSKGHGGEGSGEGRPSKGHGDEGSGDGRPSKGHGGSRHEGLPSKGQTEAHPSKGDESSGEGRPSKGHGGEGSGEGSPSKGGEGSGEAHPSKGGEGHPSKGHGGSRHEGLPSKGQTEAHPSKGDESSGEGRPSKGHGGQGSGEGRPSKGGEGRPSKGHGGEGRPSKGGEGSGEGRPSKGHADVHPSKGGEGISDGRPSKGHGGKGSGEGRPSKGHTKGCPSKGGEGDPPGSQPSNQSQSLSSHILFTGSVTKTTSGGPPLSVNQSISEHGHSSKDGEGSSSMWHHDSHPSKEHKEDHPNCSHPLPDQSQSISSHVPFIGSGGKTSGGPPFLVGQTTSDHGSHPSKGSGGSSEDTPSKGGMVSHSEGRPPGSQPSSGGPPLLGGQLTSGHGSHPSKGNNEGSGQGHLSKGSETSLPASQPSSVQSQSLSSHVPVTGNGSKILSVGSPFLGGKPTSDHGGKPSKGGKGSAEGRPSKGHKGLPSKGNETSLPGSQPSSVQSQSLISHVSLTGSGSKISSGGPPFLGGKPTSDHGGKPSKGGKVSGQDHPSKGSEGRGQGHLSKGSEGRGQGHPSKSNETSLTGSQQSSVQSLSLHVPVSGSGSKISSGGPPFLGGKPTSDHGGKPSKGSKVSGQDHPSKGSEGRGQGHPSKSNETSLTGSQQSSVQSLSLHVPVSGSGSKISSGGPPFLSGKPTSDHGGKPSKGSKVSGQDHPSKGSEGRGQGHPSKSNETSLTGSQQSSVQSLSLHVPVSGSSSKISSGGPHFLGGEPTSDHGGKPSEGGKVSGQDHPSKGSEGRGQGHLSKGSEGRGQGHPSRSNETSLTGSQQSSVQSLSLHVPVSGSGSKISSGGPPFSGGEPTSDHGGKPSKGSKVSGQDHPSKGSEGRGQGHPSKSNETSLTGSQQSSVQSLSLHVPVSGSGSKISSGGPPFSGGEPTSDHGGKPSKGSKVSGQDHPSKGSEGRGQGHPSKSNETSLTGSQPSSVQSQSLSSHVLVTGSSSKTSSGGPPFLHVQPASDHGDRPSKGHEGSHEGHPSKGGEGRPPKGHGRGWSS